MPMTVTRLPLARRRQTALVVAAAMTAAGIVCAASSTAAPSLRRLSGPIAYYNPTEVKVSSNGRYVVLAAWLSVLPGQNTDAWDDNDGMPAGFPLQIISFDLKTGKETLVSHTTKGRPGNGYSMSPSISDDGRYIVFASDATDLVAGDSNAARDVFRFDRTTNAITRLDLDSKGHEVEIAHDPTVVQVAGDLPTISGDGSTVAFLSDGNVTNDPSYKIPQGSNCTGVFIRRLTTGKVSAVTDIKGRVARSSMRTIPIDIDGDGTRQIEWGGGNTRVHLPVSRPALNRDGTIVAFAMQNLPYGNPSYVDFGVKEPAQPDDVFLRNLRTGTTTLVTSGPVYRTADTSPTDNPSDSGVYYNQVSLDATGQRCLFSEHVFTASTEPPIDSDVLLYDTQNRSLHSESAQPGATGAHSQSSSEGALSTDGKTIVFSSGPDHRRFAGLGPEFEGPSLLYRTAAAATPSPSVVTGTEGTNTDTFRSPSLSANGQVLAFITSASLTGDDPDAASSRGPSHYAREDVYVQTS